MPIDNGTSAAIRDTMTIGAVSADQQSSPILILAPGRAGYQAYPALRDADLIVVAPDHKPYSEDGEQACR